MIKSIQKSWPFVTCLFSVVLLLTSFFLPSARTPLAQGIMILGLTATLAFAIQKSVDAFRQGGTGGSPLLVVILQDLLGMLLTVTAAILSGALIGGMVGRMAGEAAENLWPGVGGITGMLAGLIGGLLAGGVAALGVTRLWSRLTASWRRGEPSSGGRVALEASEPVGRETH